MLPVSSISAEAAAQAWPVLASEVVEGGCWLHWTSLMTSSWDDGQATAWCRMHLAHDAWTEESSCQPLRRIE
jgi:hypothetical protein